MTGHEGPLAGRVGRGLGWSTGSNIVLRIGNFLVSLIMARLIAPEEFGVFAVALTVWSVLGTLAEFGLGTDLVRAKDVERRIPTVATMGLITSWALAASMALAATPIAAAFESPASAGVIRVLSLSLAVFGFSIVPAALLQRAFRQAALFAINGTALVVSTSTMTVLALLDFGPMALALGQLAGQVVTVVAQYGATRLRPRFGFNPTIARESAAFCLPLAFANLVSWLLLSIDNLVVSRVMSPTELGLYVLAFNVSSWPMSAIGQSIRVVALPAFAGVDSPQQRARSMAAASGPVWAVALPLAVVLGVMAGPVVTLLYGPRWAAAAAALGGLAAFGALRVMFDLIATFLIAVGTTTSVLAVQIWWLVVMVPAMVFAVRWFGLVGAGWSHVAVGVLAVLPAYLVCLARAGVHWRTFLGGWAVPSAAVIPAGIGCWWIARHVDNALTALVLGGVTLLALYVAPMARWWYSKVRSIGAAGRDAQLAVQ